MTIQKFRQKIVSVISTGDVFENPGGGTSEILSLSEEAIRYKRGKSSISVKFSDLYDAQQRFSGSLTSASDLKKFMPHVFDPKARPAGHSCNCTLLFTILGKAGLAGPIVGRGVRGDPFSADIK